MYLREVLHQLSTGEFAQLAIGGTNESGILEKDWPAIVDHVNLALADLYTRFPLREETVIIQQEDEINTYFLQYKYAQTNLLSPEPIKYIMDSVYEPFYENVLRVESVQDEDGQELFLNDETQTWSVFTPSHNSIMVPLPAKENAMLIKYRAGHPKLSREDVNPDTLEISLPMNLLQSLLLFIAQRVHTVSPSPEGSNLGSTYLQRYLGSILGIERYNQFNKANPTSHKLENSGFI